MKRRLILCVVITFAGGYLFGQNLDLGKKNLYYHKYQSAKDAFEKILASTPGNPEAVYWLGQTLIKSGDSLAAKALYEKTLAATAELPLVLTGLGQINLMENKSDEARQRFESALNLSDQKDIEVFHAVARANIEARSGDANYALEKLNAIPKRRKRDQKNAESYLLMGKAYRKLINGGEAVTAFRQALAMDPALAEAKYEIGKVYLSQNNTDFFLPAFEEATTIDPKYAPAFYELFFYWFNRDINKARDYFNSYLAVSDVDASAEYDRISIMFASRDFKGAVDSSLAKIASLGDKADPRYYKLAAYSYDELKDSVSASKFMEQYFLRQQPAEFVPLDFVFRAKLLSKFPGNDAEVMRSYEKAVESDTSLAGKLKIMSDAAAFSAKSGKFAQQADWLGRIYQNTKNPSNRDLYDWGYAHYKSGDFVKADSIFCGIYTQKYPTEIFGYLWCARSAGAQDTSMEKGTAVEPYKRLISFARASGNRADYKSTLIQAHGYLASYYANVAKDKDSAVAYLQNILNLDPDNESATQYIKLLTRPDPKPAAVETKERTSAMKKAER